MTVSDILTLQLLGGYDCNCYIWFCILGCVKCYHCLLMGLYVFFFGSSRLGRCNSLYSCYYSVFFFFFYFCYTHFKLKNGSLYLTSFFNLITIPRNLYFVRTWEMQKEYISTVMWMNPSHAKTQMLQSESSRQGNMFRTLGIDLLYACRRKLKYQFQGPDS